MNYQKEFENVKKLGRTTGRRGKEMMCKTFSMQEGNRDNLDGLWSCQLLKKLLASLLLLFLGLVNCKSLKYSNGVNVISTVGKTFALTVVIIAGFINLGQSRDLEK